LESCSTGDRGSNAELFHWPDASAHADLAESDEIDAKDTCWLLCDPANPGLFRCPSAAQTGPVRRCFPGRPPLKEVTFLPQLHGAGERPICYRIVFLERRPSPWRDRHHAQRKAGPPVPIGNETTPAALHAISNGAWSVTSSEREHTVRVALEQFMRRVPLPTILLRWNLGLVYRNQSASDFCSVWQRGAEQTRLIKSEAPLPLEVVDRCRMLKERWKRLNPLSFPTAAFRHELVHHPMRRHLRATISLKQISSAGVARPHFLVEFENLHGADVRREVGTLPHLVQLTRREQQLARLVCDGRSNQEIADESGLSLETVKKHLHNVFGKLEVSSRSRLMALMR
jgi:DNA-binding CsgD family transcriptional regulator